MDAIYKNCATTNCTGKAKEPFEFCYNCNMKIKGQKQEGQQTFTSANNVKPADESKINSIALAYAKDLLVAGTISKAELPQYMAIFKQAIVTGICPMVVTEETVK